MILIYPLFGKLLPYGPLAVTQSSPLPIRLITKGHGTYQQSLTIKEDIMNLATHETSKSSFLAAFAEESGFWLAPSPGHVFFRGGGGGQETGSGTCMLGVLARMWTFHTPMPMVCLHVQTLILLYPMAEVGGVLQCLCICALDAYTLHPSLMTSLDVNHSTTTLSKCSNHGCYNLTVFQVKMTSLMCWRGLWIWLPLGSHWDRL